MPLFNITDTTISKVKPTGFKTEKILQNLIEKNLEEIFNCRFIASEFSTGQVHGGRIDTLAISEDSNPVIIEYKNIESSQLINQSLYYLYWLRDHRGDYEKAVNNVIKNAEVDWTAIRVICIAPGYKKYDIHAAQVMGAPIELWQYKLYDNNHLYLEEVLQKSVDIYERSESEESGKNPVMVEAGKKAALTRQTGVYTIEEHLSKVNGELKEIAMELMDFASGLDDAVVATPKKLYIAFKMSQNFLCLEFQKKRLILLLKIDNKDLDSISTSGKGITRNEYFGTGNYAYFVSSRTELEEAKKLIKLSFDNIGG